MLDEPPLEMPEELAASAARAGTFVVEDDVDDKPEVGVDEVVDEAEEDIVVVEKGGKVARLKNEK